MIKSNDFLLISINKAIWKLIRMKITITNCLKIYLNLEGQVPEGFVEASNLKFYAFDIKFKYHRIDIF